MTKTDNFQICTREAFSVMFFNGWLAWIGSYPSVEYDDFGEDFGALGRGVTEKEAVQNLFSILEKWLPDVQEYINNCRLLMNSNREILEGRIDDQNG